MRVGRPRFQALVVGLESEMMFSERALLFSQDILHYWGKKRAS